jgi:DNA-binding XRE family transcriptional regulator
MRRKDEVIFSREECETLQKDLAKAIGAVKEHLDAEHYAVYELEKILWQICEKMILKKSYSQVVNQD